jgi:hypothetical protein
LWKSGSCFSYFLGDFYRKLQSVTTVKFK